MTLKNDHDKEVLLSDLREVVNNVNQDKAKSVSESKTSAIQKEYTLEEIGLELGVTRERIRQIEAKALKKLQHISRSKLLRAFAED